MNGTYEQYHEKKRGEREKKKNKADVPQYSNTKYSY